MLILPRRGGSTIKSEPRALEPVPRAPLPSNNKSALVSVLANLRNPRALTALETTKRVSESNISPLRRIFVGAAGKFVKKWI